MKNLLLPLLLLASVNSFAGSIEVKVNGMVCSMCAQGIQKKFKAHPEVNQLKVDLDNKVVMIHTHEGQDLADETITKLITEAGYNVASIERK